jgi:hypothetical protein
VTDSQSAIGANGGQVETNQSADRANPGAEAESTINEA